MRTCSNRWAMTRRWRNAVPLVFLVCVELVACRSSGGAGGGGVGGTDGPADAPAEVACQTVDNGASCLPIVACRACDAGLCGPVTNLAGCDSEDQICVPDCGGPACTCLFGVWSCPTPAPGCPPADAGADAP